MDMSNPIQRKVFLDLHAGLPRQSCGSAASTLHALEIVKTRLQDNPYIADFGCGPGSSVIPLATALPNANFIALDLYPPFIDELNQRTQDAELSNPIEARAGDMLSPDIASHSLDLIWCEGAIYNTGIARALKQWFDYLKPTGCIVFNEPIWLTSESDRPAPLKNFWSAYPGMTDNDGVRTAIKSAGFDIFESFDLPEQDWWDEYYNALEARLELLEEQYFGDESARIPLTYSRTEIAMRRKYAAHYNYRFYCVEPDR